MNSKDVPPECPCSVSIDKKNLTKYDFGSLLGTREFYTCSNCRKKPPWNRFIIEIKEKLN